jgi:uncharacterized protein with NRDE domain
MCILFLAINQHREYPLLICANRDEFYQRPTSAAHFWSDRPSILAGKDLQAGGSWLGVNKQGYFAAITNIRTGEKSVQDKLSRGELVTLALQQDSPITTPWLELHGDLYNPFNLVYGSLEHLVCYNSVSKKHTSLSDGFHAISNGELDDVWPKMARGEKQLEAIVNLNQLIEPAQLFSILKDQQQAQENLLPKTGVSVEWEQLLSSIFINSTEYGTRSSCLILQKNNRSIELIERQYNEQGNTVGQLNFSDWLI